MMGLKIQMLFSTLYHFSFIYWVRQPLTPITLTTTMPNLYKSSHFLRKNRMSKITHEKRKFNIAQRAELILQNKLIHKHLKNKFQYQQTTNQSITIYKSFLYVIITLIREKKNFLLKEFWKKNFQMRDKNQIAKETRLRINQHKNIFP